MNATVLDDAIHVVDWDIALKMSQIAFFIITAAVAVLTFQAAKRGLLNTVYTEYHKRVFDHIHELLSEEFGEFDSKSDKYWLKIDEVGGFIRGVSEQMEGVDRTAPRDTVDFFVGAPVTPPLEEAFRKREYYTSDPFLPPELRRIVVNLYEKRISGTIKANHELMEWYEKAVRKSSAGSEFPKLGHNQVVDAYRQHGVGIADNQRRLIELRDAVADYFATFDVLKRGGRRKDFSTDSSTKKSNGRIRDFSG